MKKIFKVMKFLRQEPSECCHHSPCDKHTIDGSIRGTSFLNFRYNQDSTYIVFNTTEAIVDTCKFKYSIRISIEVYDSFDTKKDAKIVLKKELLNYIQNEFAKTHTEISNIEELLNREPGAC